MAGETGIRVKRVDFSDPQGGKGACDRKAATVKAHVRRYVNEGHNVVTVREFHDAMLSHRGITVCEWLLSPVPQIRASR